MSVFLDPWRTHKRTSIIFCLTRVWISSVFPCFQTVFKRTTTYVPFLLVGSYFSNEVCVCVCACGILAGTGMKYLMCLCSSVLEFFRALCVCTSLASVRLVSMLKPASEQLGTHAPSASSSHALCFLSHPRSSWTMVLRHTGRTTTEG